MWTPSLGEADTGTGSKEGGNGADSLRLWLSCSVGLEKAIVSQCSGKN